MKKQRILLVVLTLFLAGLCLCACVETDGENIAKGKFSDIYSLDEIKTPGKAISVELTTDINLPFHDVRGDFAYFLEVDSDEEKADLLVYDLANGKIVYEKSERISSDENEEYQLREFDNAFAVLNLGDCRLIDKNGSIYKTVEGVQDIEDELHYFHDLVILKDTAYRLENGKFVEEFNVAGLAVETSYSSTSIVSDGYYCEIRSDDNGKKLVVRDSHLKPYYVYSVPEGVEDSALFMVGEGLAVAQYRYELPEDAQNYDFYEQNKKYDIQTVLIDIARRDVESIELNGMLNSVLFFSKETKEDMATYGYKLKGIDILASISFISDGRLLENKRYAVTENMEVIYEINDYFDVPIATVLPLSNQAFGVVLQNFNLYYIVDERGKIIFMLDEIILTATESYIVTGSSIYNYEGKRLYTIDEDEDRTFAFNFGDTLYFEEESTGNLYTFNKSDTGRSNIDQLIIDRNIYEYNTNCAEFGFYCRYERDAENRVYRYWNQEGEVIYRGTRDLIEVEDTEHGMLMVDEIYSEDGEFLRYQYYLFTREEPVSSKK